MHSLRFVLALFVVAFPACGGESQRKVHRGSDEGRSGSSGTAGTSGSAGTAGTGGSSGTAGTGAAPPTGGSAGEGGSGGVASASLWIYGLAEGDGNLVATALEAPGGANEGHGVIFHSIDGLEWSRVATDLPYVPFGVAYGNGRFVTLATRYEASSGALSASAYFSEDGITWTNVEIPAANCGQRLAFGNGFFLGICNGSHLRSEDGTSWATVGPASQYPHAVEFAGGKFLSFQASSTSAWVGDGDTFDAVDVTGDRIYSIAALRAKNDGFLGKSRYDCCFGEQGPPSWARLSSDDGSVWTHEVLPSEPPEILLDDGSLCIGFLGMKVLTGATCDSLDRETSVPFTPLVALKANNLYLVGGGPYGGGIIASIDGVSWTNASLPVEE